MNYSVFAAFLFLPHLLTANNFPDYKSHIANDRVILIFDKNTSAARKGEIIGSSGLVSHFAHVPSPALTICFVNSFDEAQKYFSSISEIKYVSFFITDGKQYAGVLDDFFVKIKDKNFEPLLRQKLKEEIGGEAIPDRYIPNLYNFRYSANEGDHGVPIPGHPASVTGNIVDFCISLAGEGWVEYATPNYLLNPLVTSNDSYYARQWNIANTGSTLQGHGTLDADMDVDSAWTISTGDSIIKVAIIDSGVDTLHPDLRQNILPGHDAVNDSTDGYPTPAFDFDGHGTCCAGIVAAVKDNAQGIAGVAPSCKIIPVRAFYYFQLSPPPAEPIPVSSAAVFADAIGWAWNHAGADILSNSWGLPASLISVLPGGTQPVDDAIQLAWQNGRNGKGVAMFFSSGNEEDSTGPIWPGRLSQTIAVNATNMCDKRKSANDCSGEPWSGNWGSGLDFSAPGVKITTTDMIGTYGFSLFNYTFAFNGTSAACPNAAAVGALLLSIRPDLTAEDIRNVIAQSCDKVGGYTYNSGFPNGTWSRELGYGRVNAYRALLLAPAYSAIKEPDEAIRLYLFPNPSDGRIQIQYGGDQNEKMIIYDLNGKELLRAEIHPGGNNVDAEFLTSGIYMVRVDAKSGSITKKITILR